MGAEPDSLDLYHDDVLTLSSERKIEMAQVAEQAALDADPRVNNSEGGGFGSGWSRWVLANSRGFAGAYRGTSCSLSVVPLAESNGNKERDYWYSVARCVRSLQSPEEIGRIAAERVVRRLNARKISTTQAPIVFEAPVAKSLLGHILSAISGDSVYRKASFLADHLGKPVANTQVTIIDDGLWPGGFGTSPFDDEGTPSRRTTVIQDGGAGKLFVKLLHGSQAGTQDDGERVARASGQSGRRCGQFHDRTRLGHRR